MEAIDVVLMVTAGRGPAECKIAAARVARRLAADADAAGLSTALDLPDGCQAAACILVSLGGAGVEAFAQSWTGTILWIDDALRGARARRNWYVGVHRLDPPKTTSPLAEADVRYEAMRAGGPGGQHQNVTESAIRAVHVPTGLSALARDGRSQHQNRKRANERLRALLAGIADAQAAGARRVEWRDRTEVERGNPKRIFRSAP
ncbi:peptide chain release factor H [Methylobacterium sp. Leaf93]|uniref:peptide chain release factor H n=1 Tax=Methylobacterium sp. Leaf93 TaxID=1736249 RepID=UPI0006F3735A|nr:peptide chain release factor H [Methylobacterium sp. Leaf93]KQP05419.1 hypothetical protein ASF26_08220 [Methylobacterium sp. Leaf93]